MARSRDLRVKAPKKREPFVSNSDTYNSDLARDLLSALRLKRRPKTCKAELKQKPARMTPAGFVDH